MEIESGQQLREGRFEVLSRIGQGGAGLVYEVRDRKSDARLALKTVRSADPDALLALKREFRAVQDVAHPNLVRLDELFEEQGAWFFTMELVDGVDWLRYVTRPAGAVPRYDEARLRASLAQVVSALSALHAMGMVHRDVKPPNVLVTRDGHVKLLDFGIVASTRDVDPTGAWLVGTVAYMAPEQLASEEPTPAADLYAVGAMLHEALTGHVPFFDRDRPLSQEKLTSAATPVLRVAPQVPADLAALCDALLRTEPADRPDAAEILRLLGAADGAASSGVLGVATEHFVGRGRELQALRDAWAEVLGGSAVNVVIEGPSGVGKTALVRHFLGELAGRALVLQGRCHEREYVPYKGIDAIVDRLATHLAADEGDDPFDPGLDVESKRLLLRLFPVLEPVPAFQGVLDAEVPSDAGDPRERRARTFAAFRALVSKVAAERPIVLVIDDVQWADGDTLALLGDLLAPPNPPEVLLLGTRRVAEDAGDRELESLHIPGELRRIEVGALSEGDVATLATELAGSSPLAAGDVAALVQESGGHPLFLQELVRRRRDGERTGEARTLRLDDALWTRVTRLTDSERRLVEAVAVAGVPTSLEVIAAAAQVPRGDLPGHMATLRTASLVKGAGSAEGRRVEPYHDRVREAVTLHLGGEPTRMWHERLARAIEASDERDVERLAVHWEAAGDQDRAARLYAEAAERATSALAFDRAADFCRRALALFPASAPEVPALSLGLAEALFNGGRGGEAGRAFSALADARQGALALDLRRRAAMAFLGSGHFAEGIAAQRAVLAAVGIELPKGAAAIFASFVWQGLRLKVRGLDVKTYDPARADAKALMAVDVCQSAALGIGMADTITGAVLHHKGGMMALDLGEPLRAARGLCGLALAICTGGLKTRDLTAELIRRARGVAAELSDPYIHALVEGADGFAAFMLEDWVRAERSMRLAETRLRGLRGVSYELATLRVLYSRTLLNLGKLREIEPLVGAPLRDAVRRNDVYSVVNTRAFVSVLLALAHDDVPAAEREVAELQRLVDRGRFHLPQIYGLVAACQLDLYAGRPDAAVARIEATAAPLRRSLLEKVQSVRVMLDSLRARAYLARAAASGEKGATRARDLATAQRFAARLASEGLPGAEALGALASASVASLKGDAVGAERALRDATARCDRSAMALHAAIARHHLGTRAAGAEGDAFAREAAAFFTAQGIEAPARFAALYAPGL